MADTSGHGSAAPHHDDHDDAHDAHDEIPEEDAVRTPLWLTLVGFALLLLGALGSYLFVYPGRMSASTSGDAGGADASAAGDGGAEPQTRGGGQPGAAGQLPQPARPGGLQIVPQIVEPGQH